MLSPFAAIDDDLFSYVWSNEALSEIGGRNPVYAITLLSFVIFQIGAALATNIETRLLLRFLAGLAGSTPLSNAGGTLADVANARQRTFIFPVFACAAFMGPTIGMFISLRKITSSNH